MIVLSYPQYCRYRSMLKRIQDKPSSILTDQFALALGGIAMVSRNPQILYCRDTFDHPTLIENESICDEFGECLSLILLNTRFSVHAMSSAGKQDLPSPPYSTQTPCYCSTRRPHVPGSDRSPQVKDDCLVFAVQYIIGRGLVDLEGRL